MTGKSLKRSWKERKYKIKQTLTFNGLCVSLQLSKSQRWKIRFLAGPPVGPRLIQTVDYRNVGPLNLFKKRSFWRCRLFSRSNDCYSVCFEPLIWDDETPRFVNCVHALTLLWTTRKFSQNRNLSSKSVHQSILIALPRTFANLIHCVALANSFKKTARVLW